MKIDATTHQKLPEHLKALFQQAPNPSRDEVLALFPDSAGAGASLPRVKITGYGSGIGTGESAYLGGERIPFNAGSGSAARFFYCPKASKADRNSGGVDNVHETVKPTDLMAYLCRLVTPPGGVVLDPFMGSGSTGKAAVAEGFRFIGCELDQDEKGNPLGYSDIAEARIVHAWKEWCEGRLQGSLFDCVEDA